MAKRVVLRKQAEDEATEARLWYENINDAVAVGFLRELKEALVSISNNPQAFGNYEAEPRLRMRILRKYPYVVLYHEIEDVVEVIAIAHTSREPGYWKDSR